MGTEGPPWSWASALADWGGFNEGNREQRWSEQVAWRSTAPPWQNWDGGRNLLPPPTGPPCQTVRGAEAEAYASTDSGRNTERPPHDGGGAPEGPGHTSQVGESNTGAVGRRSGVNTDLSGWMSSPGPKMQDEHEHPPTCPGTADESGTKMHNVDEDTCNSPEFGDLPEDLSEFLNEDYLSKIDADTLFSEPLWNCDDDPSKSSAVTEPRGSGAVQHKQEDRAARKTNQRTQGPRVSQPQPPSDGNTLSPPKKQRIRTPQSNREEVRISKPSASQSRLRDQETGTGISNLAEANTNYNFAGLPPGTDQEPEPSPSDAFATPCRLLQFRPSIQLIAIPDSPRYQVVQTLSLSPPVLTIPVSATAAAPTYIFVPPASPPKSLHPPPLSPADGAVAPVQVSSFPPGSLSDTASRAVFPPRATPPSPVNEAVRDYILGVKAHLSQSCEDMDGGLTLSSHYVEVQVSEREIVRCGKSTSKAHDKELILSGDTHRQRSLIGQDQIFEGSKGDNPKRYILLLGSAGMGKSTLIKKLLLDWCKDRFPQFDFVFRLDRRLLTLTTPTFSLQTLLLNLSSSSSAACSDPEAVYARVVAAPQRVLLVFDGFAEIRDLEMLLQPQEKDLVALLQKGSRAQAFTVKQLFASILQRALLPGSTLLLSARPRGATSQLLRRTDSYLEMRGFSPSDVETYVSRYFADPALRESALERLRGRSYLHLLCWNPGLCRLLCSILEEPRHEAALPGTVTELCCQALAPRLRGCARTPSACEAEGGAEPSPGGSGRSRGKARKPRQSRSTDTEEEEEEEEPDLLSQLSSLAWDGVKSHSAVLPGGRALSPRLKDFGQRTGLLVSHDLRTRHLVSSGEVKGGGGEAKRWNKRSKKGCEDGAGQAEDRVLLWASPHLQSYLAALHLCLSRTVSHRTFSQSLPLLSNPKSRRRIQREVLELTQRFALQILIREIKACGVATKTWLREMLASKQDHVTKHLKDLSHGDLSPAQLLEACHYVYEASVTRGDESDAGLKGRLVTKLPEVLVLRGVPLNPLDAFVVRHVLEKAGEEGHSFSLDVDDSEIQISGLKALVSLGNINTYRACIADVITLWEELQQSGEEEIRRGAVSKFKIHPLKASQVCHIEQLAKLVDVHVQKRLPDSTSQSDPILAEGVPAVKELRRLEFELGPEKGPKALPKLWELLPGLHNLQHLDLENSKMGDRGAVKLANVLVSLGLLEVLNLSQNCIGDEGMEILATTLRDLPKLQCLSLYSNMISDEGAKSLAAVLPHMASLTDLDVKYNRLTDVGAQSLGLSLKRCENIKTLRMWNECIPYGVFERLQQQDSRILCH